MECRLRYKILLLLGEKGVLMAYSKEQEQELYFANVVIGAIKNVETPMLMFKGEKDVVEKALRMYIDKIEADSRR